MSGIPVTVDVDSPNLQSKKMVILGGIGYTKDKFIEYIIEKLSDSNRVADFQWEVSALKSWTTHKLKGGNIKTVKTEFMQQYNELMPILNRLLGGQLGGTVGLSTVFNVKSPNAEICVASDMRDIPLSQTDAGINTKIHNTKNNANKAASKIHIFNEIEKELVHHYNGFYRQLHGVRPFKDDSIWNTFCLWASKTNFLNNVRERTSYKKHSDMRNYSLSQMFFGFTKNTHGQIYESYMGHLPLIHNFLLKNVVSDIKINKSVISELGGVGSVELYELLSASNNNVPWYLGGDFIVVGDNGEVFFNYQMKATKFASYEFKLTYESLKQSVFYLHEALSDLAVLSDDPAKSKIQIKKIAEDLFNRFSRTVWVKMAPKVNDYLNNMITEELQLESK